MRNLIKIRGLAEILILDSRQKLVFSRKAVYKKEKPHGKDVNTQAIVNFYLID